jgi:hypothetical protein
VGIEFLDVGFDIRSDMRALTLEVASNKEAGRE